MITVDYWVDSRAKALKPTQPEPTNRLLARHVPYSRVNGWKVPFVDL